MPDHIEVYPGGWQTAYKELREAALRLEAERDRLRERVEWFQTAFGKVPQEMQAQIAKAVADELNQERK